MNLGLRIADLGVGNREIGKFGLRMIGAGLDFGVGIRISEGKNGKLGMGIWSLGERNWVFHNAFGMAGDGAPIQRLIALSPFKD